jgi:uncharacterized coiled-coil protein SlyX
MPEEPILEPADKEPNKPASAASLPSNAWLKVAATLLAVAAVFATSYAWHEFHAVQQQASSADALSASLSQARTQIDALTAKLNALNTVPAVAPAESQPAATQAPARQTTRPHRVRRASQERQQVPMAEGPRWKQVEAELAEQQKQIDEHQKEIQSTQESVQRTRTELEGNLKSTRDELGGSIARNHEEIVALGKKGDRNYYEFNLLKSKNFKTVGPLGVSLRKANSKHEYCDLELIVSDNQLAEKHVMLYQPVLLYPEGFSQPLELVINHIEKNTVLGYLSEPKYKPTEPAKANSGSGQPTPTASSSPGDTSTSAVSLQRRPAPQQ